MLRSKISFLTDNVLIELLKQDKSLLSDHQLNEIQRMLLCHDPSQGYVIFQCPDCSDSRIIHYSCNSRLCPSCGRRMTEEWAERVRRTLLDCPHRHCVFTLPGVLWRLMKDDRELIEIVSKELLTVVKNVFNRCSALKGKKITPGITCVLHTFGEDLKFNVHFHSLITCGGVDEDGQWVPLNFFFYEGLRKVWQYHVLTAIKKHLPKCPENNIFIDAMFKTHPDGFYVYAKDTVTNNTSLLRYIARYVRHPAIAQSRIMNFDGKTVTFICNKNEDEKEHIVSMPVQEFLLAIAQHIPPKGFQLIKHLGVYANKSRRKYASVISMFRKKVNWIKKKLLANTPKCKVCGGFMKVLEIFPPTDPPRHLLLSSYRGQQKLSVSS